MACGAPRSAGGAAVSVRELAAVLEGRRQWCVLEGDCTVLLPYLADNAVDHVSTDPPYSPHVHGKQRRGTSVTMGNGKPAFHREADLGFAPVNAHTIGTCAREAARVARRWVLAFSDVELCHSWREAFTREGLHYVRTGAWIKEACTPQFSGDRPAAGFEAITIAHRKGRKRWNGGGSRAVWSFPVVARRGANANPRVHTTPKPLDLMLELVRLFADHGDVVLDPFAGSGTTGVAALTHGCRFIGIELDPTHAQTARDALTAAECGSTIHAFRAGQLGLFGAPATQGERS